MNVSISNHGFMPAIQATSRPDIHYICPFCKSSLELISPDTIICLGCRISYPIVLSIPDFRGPNCEAWMIADRERTAMLVSQYSKTSFEALVRLRFNNLDNIPIDIFKYHLTHELNYAEKGSIRKRRIIHLLGLEFYNDFSKEVCLDVGCGTGSSLFAIAEDFKFGLGVDVLMQDLILGKKYAEENEIDNIQYVCAFGEDLPFESDTFDLINATDTIEHMEYTQESFLREVKRILKPGGVFCFNSPNRYNLFTPEPHVKIWGLGFLPRHFMNPACQIIKGVEYRGKRLLSYFELKRLLKRAFRQGFRIEGLIIDPSQAKRRFIGKIFNLFPLSLKIFNTVFRYLTTNYQVLVFKE
jgi:ubiquinone/menaquinone biosynthesis C-methylase UbiE